MNIEEKWKIFMATAYDEYIEVVDLQFGEGYTFEEKEEAAFQMWLLDAENRNK